jgi:hypothetical protein
VNAARRNSLGPSLVSQGNDRISPLSAPVNVPSAHSGEYFKVV